MTKIYTIGELLIDFIPNKSNCGLKDVDSFSKMAGGAFVGGILNFIDKRKKSIDKYSSADVQDMLDFANKVAAYSVTKYGAMASYPRVEDL